MLCTFALTAELSQRSSRAFAAALEVLSTTERDELLAKILLIAEHTQFNW